MTRYYKAFIPALVASCASYLVFVLITHLNLGPTWNFPAYTNPKVGDIFYAVAYSLAGAAIGWIFILFVRNFKLVFKRLNLAIYLRLTIGGFVLGIISYYIPLTRYFGHEQLTEVLKSTFTLQFLCVLLLFKLIAIAVTVTAGWRGGFIIPLLFAGTVLGLIIFQLFPGQNLALITVCCMASLNACVTRTPVSIIILLAAMTGLHNIVPVIFASLTGYFLAPKLPLIQAQLRREKSNDSLL
ncbi:Chloride channel protein [Arcticibacter svalbardensis MN12-7]|uniref:Chloride channel protein n=1 Tax=Arcticibacter svalbardensis MN12-7 TaxID=1150600 RepID=R9GT74_9SPHI|nr:chloride channel protein [Arcticibacter svalbardensis]EOR94916.1 Chloride channel protein [Arcticibacter svalbardensis MN12-7]